MSLLTILLVLSIRINAPPVCPSVETAGCKSSTECTVEMNAFPVTHIFVASVWSSMSVNSNKDVTLTIHCLFFPSSMASVRSRI